MSARTPHPARKITGRHSLAKPVPAQSSAPAPVMLPSLLGKRPSQPEIVELSDSDDDGQPATKKARLDDGWAAKRPLGVVNRQLAANVASSSALAPRVAAPALTQKPAPAKFPARPPAQMSAPTSVNMRSAVLNAAPAVTPALAGPVRPYSALSASTPTLLAPVAPTPIQSSSLATAYSGYSTLDALSRSAALDEADTDDEPIGDLFSALGPGYEQFAGLGRIPLHNIPASGFRASANDLATFINQANQEQFDENVGVKDGMKDLGLHDIGDCLPGMVASLMPHQILGVSWMKQRETTRSTCSGGILADAMGLGKTVQSIALMCTNPSNSKELGKSTLILAPLALLAQWKAEVIKFTDSDVFTVLIYHGSNRPKSRKEIERYDIVLTTYHTLANEWVDEEAELRRAKRLAKAKAKNGFIDDDDADDPGKDMVPRKHGPLMNIMWYRIIIDEAQNIRNKDTRASKVVTQLLATHRWCLTGTPITNSLKDAFGMLRFLQHRPFGDWEEFRDHIAKHEAKRGKMAADRTQAIFNHVLLRRNKESTLDGKKLIELPPRTEEFKSLQLSKEERDIYDFVLKRSQAVFNRFLRAGTVLKNYATVLVMLLRLRQITVHPVLITWHENAFDTPDNRPDELKEVLEQAATLLGNDFVVLVKHRLLAEAKDRIAEEQKRGKKAVIEGGSDQCSICFEPFDMDAVVTACCHFFCKGCIEAHLARARDEGSTLKDPDERECPLCRKGVSPKLLFKKIAFEPSDSELGIDDPLLDELEFSWEEDKETGSGRYKATATAPKRKPRRSVVIDSDDDMDDFIVADDEPVEVSSRKSSSKRSVKPAKRRVVISSDEEEEETHETIELSDSDDEFAIENLGKSITLARTKGKAPRQNTSSRIEVDDEVEELGSGSKGSSQAVQAEQPAMMSRFMPSAKMKWMMEELKRCEKEHPDEKTMILSQWTSALDLVADYLAENGFRYVRFQGSMNISERNAAVETFMKNSKIKILLMSLKAGGVGLNLTAGNRVIAMDLAWNNATDQQAFDRVHRLGQQKPVEIHRLVIEDSVEDRIRAIQDTKQGLSDGALGEGSGKKMTRLSVAQLAALFGIAA